MTVRELLLVRHGESLGNLAAAEADRAGALRIDVPARDADVDLSPRGEAQAAALGRHLAALDADERPDALWVSTYLRARRTAEIALAGDDLLHEARIDERLRDRELGVLDALTWRGVEALHPDEAARRRHLGKYYHRPPGGESWADLALRLRSLLSDLDREPAARVLVVAHDAVVSVIRMVLLRIPETDLLEGLRRHPMPNTARTRLVRDGGDWRVAELHVVDHLEDAGVPTTLHGGEPDGHRS